MAALLQMAQLIPPRRGAYWIAAGLNFSTFALVSTTAVVYVALDRGVEVGVLGISRMALPTPDVALVSIELALKARYSSAESLLSIQAQLTDNSWLFYQDCQLTGGFAFFMWFAKAQFVLTLGGYHPAFQPPDGFPSVPRLGFHWQVSSLIVIKGEAYFALTTSCVMAGGRLEAVFDAGFVRAWFDAYADFLVSWDPFEYDIDIGISVGVSLTVTICFIGCATISATVSIGASLSISGPPFHGTVSVQYWVASVTIPFGGAPAPPSPLSWGDFSAKYLVSGDPAGTACDAAPADGLLPVDPPGAAPAPGDGDHPWRLMPEWTLQATSRVAASAVTDVQTGTAKVSSDVGELDLAPMGAQYTSVTSTLAITIDARRPDGSWAPAAATPGSITTDATESQMPEGTWHYTDQDTRTASARTLAAVTGATVTGHAVLPNQGSDIHIATLVDDLIAYAKPLPLDPGSSVLTTLRGYGVSAATLAEISAASTSQVLLGAAADLLSGPLAAAARQAVGASPAGLGPMSVRALQTGRSSPPVIAPLAAGLDMRPVNVPPALPMAPTPPVGPIGLQSPRVRAMLGTRPQPAAPVPAAVRTTVSTVPAAVGLLRTTPPGPPTLAGARLIKVPLPGALRPTAVTAAGRWRRSGELGTTLSTATATAAATDEAALIGAGLAIGAGVSYVVDLPPGAATVTASGDAGRLTLLDRGGRVLDDAEATGTWQRAVPVGAALLVATGLGTAAAAPTASAAAPVTAAPAPATGPVTARITGALTAILAPAGYQAASGWTAGTQLVSVAAQTMLCRGGWVTLNRPYANRRQRVTTHLATVRASRAVAGAAGVQTWLPGSTTVVGILLDQVNPTAADDGDLAVASTGVTLAGPPCRVGGGRRLALLYDARPAPAGAPAGPEASNAGEPVSVSVASLTGWQLAGVIGLAGGSAAEWAARWHGTVPEDLVPDGPLSPDGTLTVKYSAAPPAPPGAA
jgi:hypothetical protein